uniref:Thromboxane A2 receptor n=1 Tax=Knipowitschia caucasica TaxID=637954 RepID=A0AAV2L3E1_KNICA
MSTVGPEHRHFVSLSESNRIRACDADVSDTSSVPVNGSAESMCRTELRANSTCGPPELLVTASVISMSVGTLSNGLALFILLKSYRRVHTKTRASFLLFASSLVITDLLGHLIIGGLVLFVYSFQKLWDEFDPHGVLCSMFGACMVFFGLSPLFLGSLMAVERCIGVTRPLFHSTAVAAHHMRRLLGLSWLLPALVAVLPVLLGRAYSVQRSRSWCFFHMEQPQDWLDILLPLLFSALGLFALFLSIVCNSLTSCALLQSRLRRRQRSRSTSYHLEMICQLLVIMLVSCVCWGPLLVWVIVLSITSRKEAQSHSLLMAVRMATWNQILDPWVYILLRKAVIRKLFSLLHSVWAVRSLELQLWQGSVQRSSVDTSRSGHSSSWRAAERYSDVTQCQLDAVTASIPIIQFFYGLRPCVRSSVFWTSEQQSSTTPTTDYLPPHPPHHLLTPHITSSPPTSPPNPLSRSSSSPDPSPTSPPPGNSPSPVLSLFSFALLQPPLWTLHL